MTVIALGVVPYISASIIMQLLVALWPNLQREIRENSDQAKRKINKLTRVGTVLLAMLQSTMLAKYALQMKPEPSWCCEWRAHHTHDYGCSRALLLFGDGHDDHRNCIFDVGGRANHRARDW